MTERETVIRGLELCAYDPDPGQVLKEIRSCPECPYYRAGCSPQLIRDALTLLKEQEARVMTLKEVETSQGFVWVEFHSINENRLSLEYVNVRATERFLDSFVLATDSGIEWLRNRGDYNRGIWFGINSGWRCWSARPTPEQMLETKWEGDES